MLANTPRHAYEKIRYLDEDEWLSDIRNGQTTDHQLREGQSITARYRPFGFVWIAFRRRAHNDSEVLNLDIEVTEPQNHEASFFNIDTIGELNPVTNKSTLADLERHVLSSKSHNSNVTKIYNVKHKALKGKSIEPEATSSSYIV